MSRKPIKDAPQAVKPKYELLLKLLPGARTYLAAQQRFTNFDVAMSGGKVVALAPDIDRWDAVHVRWIPDGCVICTALIDPHVHIAPGCPWAKGIRPEQHCMYAGTPIVCDAGSMGANGFDAFRELVIDRPSHAGAPLTKIYAYVNVAAPGLATGHREGFDLTYVVPEEAAAVARAHRDIVVGIKVRIAWLQTTPTLWREFMKRALKAADLAEMPLMVHINDGPPVEQIVKQMRAGDVLTHCFHGKNQAGRSTIVTDKGKVRKGVLAAVKRGVYMDKGHGGGGFSQDIAETAMLAGFREYGPDHFTISTDLHSFCVNGPTFDFCHCMMKMRNLAGVGDAEVLSMATYNTGRMIRLPRNQCTLQVGSPANLSVLYFADADPANVCLVDAEQRKFAPQRIIQKHLVVRDQIVI